jgi:hypothetical protein
MPIPAVLGPLLAILLTLPRSVRWGMLTPTGSLKAPSG